MAYGRGLSTRRYSRIARAISRAYKPQEDPKGPERGDVLQNLLRGQLDSIRKKKKSQLGMFSSFGGLGTEGDVSSPLASNTLFGG